MSQTKVISKGYTIEVVSWENDGDNYNTKKLVVETKEEAQAWHNALKIAGSRHSGGIGNGDGFNKTQLKLIVQTFYENKILFKRDSVLDLINLCYKKEILGQELTEEELSAGDYGKDYDLLDDINDIVVDFYGKILGYSEWYSCRVVDSVKITYSPEDVYLEEVKFG